MLVCDVLFGLFFKSLGLLVCCFLDWIDAYVGFASLRVGGFGYG